MYITIQMGFDDISKINISFNSKWKKKHPRITKSRWLTITVNPKKYAHGFVVLCFVVVMQSFIINSHEVFIHIHQGCFAGTGEIVRLPQCQWSKPDGYGKISQCKTTPKHSKAKTVCIFLGIYCNSDSIHYGGRVWYSIFSQIIRSELRRSRILVEKLVVQP